MHTYKNHYTLVTMLMHLFIIIVASSMLCSYTYGAASSSTDVEQKKRRTRARPDAISTILQTYATYVHPKVRSTILLDGTTKDILRATCHAEPLPHDALLKPIINASIVPPRYLRPKDLLHYADRLNQKKRVRINRVVRYLANVSLALAERIDFFSQKTEKKDENDHDKDTDQNDHDYESYHTLQIHTFAPANKHSAGRKRYETALHRKYEAKINIMANLLYAYTHPNTTSYPIIQAFFNGLGAICAHDTCPNFVSQAHYYLTYSASILPLLTFKKSLMIYDMYVTALHNPLLIHSTKATEFVDEPMTKLLALLAYHNEFRYTSALILNRYRLYTDIQLNNPTSKAPN